MNRRTFLKTAGMGSIALAYGCGSDSSKTIYSLVTSPDDLVVGHPLWYASTCRECPAGCGVLAKNREGRTIKLEGNPHHPINRGKLCIRGQAALQSVYDPDRIKSPLIRTGDTFTPISFEEALEILQTRLDDASHSGGSRIQMLSSITSRPLRKLFADTLAQYGDQSPAFYEPISYDALRSAHQAIFSTAVLPSFNMEKTDFLLGFGADFIETWLSPVEYIRKFKSMQSGNTETRGIFVHAAPYMSLTAANADQFIRVKAGQEHILALGLLRRILAAPSRTSLPVAFSDHLTRLVSAYDATAVEKAAGVPQAEQEMLAAALLFASHPLVIGSTGITNTEADLVLEMAVTFINLALDSELALYDFENRHTVEDVMTAKQTADFFKKTASEPTDLVIFHNTNPLYTFPENNDLKTIFHRSSPFKVTFSNFMDETAMASDLIFPIQLPLETWDCYDGHTGTISTQQPAMGKLTQAPAIGDIFFALHREKPRFENYYQYLENYLFKQMTNNNRLTFMQQVQKGGFFDTQPLDDVKRPSVDADSLNLLKKQISMISPGNDDSLAFLAVPSLRLFDGRGANKSWLNEIPDPLTNVAWTNLFMVHPDTLKNQGLQHGDILRAETGRNSIEAPVYSHAGVSLDLLVMQMGQGHTAYGRYAENSGSSPTRLLSGNFENTDFLHHLVSVTSIQKTGTAKPLPQTDGSRSQYKRKIALSMTANHHDDPHHAREGLTMNTFPLTLPTKEGYDKKRDVYPPHDHVGYRWGMIIDLDLCVGCSACVAACYAENNLAITGREQIAKGREMSWLRIERYTDQHDDQRLIFLPMLCQHCDNAPCESVCPVYAPHHSKEGLNNQVYNRCIGTRFCAQNCPYKVRRFNWYDWKWPEPSNLQLNPDVTARSKGVMEKCSFCIQRIKTAHNQAKNENRKIRDGEIQPACVQTCPAKALTFGNFLDKASAVSTLARDTRAYQVLGYLNTKPAVIYMKKVITPLKSTKQG